MNTCKITPRWKEGKRLRRLARRVLGWLGIQVEVYQRCKLGQVIRFGRLLHGYVPQGPGLN